VAAVLGRPKGRRTGGIADAAQCALQSGLSVSHRGRLRRRMKIDKRPKGREPRHVSLSEALTGENRVREALRDALFAGD